MSEREHICRNCKHYAMMCNCTLINKDPGAYFAYFPTFKEWEERKGNLSIQFFPPKKFGCNRWEDNGYEELDTTL